MGFHNETIVNEYVSKVGKVIHTSFSSCVIVQVTEFIRSGYPVVWMRVLCPLQEMLKAPLFPLSSNSQTPFWVAKMDGVGVDFSGQEFIC